MIDIINFNPLEFVNQAIAYALIIAAFLSVAMIIWGGLLFIVAAGKEDRIQKAMSTIKYAIIGLVVCILSFSVVYYIGQFFGYNFFDYLSMENIISTIEEVGSKFQD